MRKPMFQDRPKYPIKVYRYGTGFTRSQELNGSVIHWALSEEDEAAVDEQLLLAHRYRYKLWQLSMAARELYRQRRRAFFPELEETEAELTRQEEIYLVLDAKEHKEQRQALKVELQRLQARAKELREAAKTNAEFDGLIQADRRRSDILYRSFRAIFAGFGLYSGTYQLVEEADRRAKMGRFDPVRPRWDGTGCLGIQIQGGTSTALVLGCKEPWLQIEPVNRVGKGKRQGSFTTARYRVRSENKKPVFVTIPLMYHRDLPEDAKITWVKLVVAKSGLRKIYSLQLTVESEKNFRQEFGTGRAAVCFNKDTITWQGEHDPEPQVLVYDPRLGKADDLQAIRDKNRNGAIGLIRAWAERADDVPEWLMEELEKNTTGASCRRAVGFVYRIERERDTYNAQVAAGQAALYTRDMLPDDALITTLKEWVTHEDHLYQWQADLRKNALAGRKYAYRCFAAKLRREYKEVLLDSRRLDVPERRTKERNDQGLYELKLAIKHSLGADAVHDVTGVDCVDMFANFEAQQQAKREKEEKARLKEQGAA